MNTLHTDLVIVGAGVAALSFAIRVKELHPKLQMVLVDKGGTKSANSYWAQGGIALAHPRWGDQPAKHAQDTLIAGNFKNNPKVVEQVVYHAPAIWNLLHRWGVKVDLLPNGQPDLATEGGHDRARVVHHADSTGASLMEALALQAQKLQIPIIRGLAKNLLLSNHGCAGLVVLANQESMHIHARLTALATGGGSAIYRHSTNPPTATADGLAMALRAGLVPQFTHWVQFHPTALRTTSKNCQLPLLTEALRGSGAVLRLPSGSAIMQGVHPQGDLAPRDVVSQTIQHWLNQGETVYLDVSVPLTNHPEHFKGVKSIIQTALGSANQTMLPVVPAAHYFCGGIEAEINGKTQLPGLLALGEVAFTGLHGNNRLASNSLLEALTMADFSAADYHELALPCIFSGQEPEVPMVDYQPGCSHQVASILQENAGVLRNLTMLNHAYSQMQGIQPKVGFDPSNLASLVDLNKFQVANLLVQQAIAEAAEILPQPASHVLQSV